MTNSKPTKPSATKAEWEKEWDKIYGKHLDELDEIVWRYYPKELRATKSTNTSMKEFIHQLLASELARERERLAGEIGKYHELIMAVENKYEGETRHETALRSIKGTECGSGQSQFTQAAKRVRRK